MKIISDIHSRDFYKPILENKTDKIIFKIWKRKDFSMNSNL